jgi:hypothetical protein
MIIINDNITYRLGKNAIENFKLIDDADPDDWWFHLDEHPSGHCIIDSNIINNQMKIFAGNLVKENSKLKNNKNVKIVFTQIKNLVKMKEVGSVLLKKQEFFYI